jgi:hypothetical protein
MEYLLYNYRNKLYDSHIGNAVAVRMCAGDLSLIVSSRKMKQSKNIGS